MSAKLAQKMMDVIGKAGTLELLNATALITTYAIDVGTTTKDLQIAEAILDDAKKGILKVLKEDCNWKFYN